MNLQQFIQDFYFDMSIIELRQMNKSSVKNLTYNSLLYVDIISFKKNCTVSFLAKTLGISKSAATVKVNELIKQGLVVKKQSDEDKRIFYLYASETSQLEYEKFDRSMNSAAKKAEASFEKKDIENFCKIMNLINEEYKKEVSNE